MNKTGYVTLIPM